MRIKLATSPRGENSSMKLEDEAVEIRREGQLAWS
jgi:hypothetical protein